MSNIAPHVSVKVGTIYHHFESKNELLVAVDKKDIYRISCVFLAVIEGENYYMKACKLE
jgi:AcrR family transcriptional regulator